MNEIDLYWLEKAKENGYEKEINLLEKDLTDFLKFDNIEIESFNKEVTCV